MRLQESGSTAEFRWLGACRTPLPRAGHGWRVRRGFANPRALGIAGNFLNVTENGKPTEQTRQCLEIVAKHDMVLATSHIRPSEMLPIVTAAKEAKVQRIMTS